MKRRTIIEKLKGLADLSDLARSYFTGDTSQWVGLGLLTEAESQEYMKGWAAEGKLSQAIEQAEDDVPRPNFETAAGYPQAYLDLVARAEVLKPLADADRRVRDILINLCSRGYTAGTSIGDRLGIQALAKAAQGAIKDADDDFASEYCQVTEGIERKTREGTIARRVRLELADEWNAARKKARGEAETRFMLEYGGVIERKRELERLIERRRTEKLQPISEAMAKVIREALPKGAK